MCYSFSSDPYPEGFRASPDFTPDIFTTYHGQEIHPRSTSPPPWFVREGDVITSNLHVVTDQVFMIMFHPFIGAANISILLSRFQKSMYMYVTSTNAT